MASARANGSFVLLLLAVAAARHGAGAQSTSSGASCLTEMLSLASCLGYVSGSSSSSAPKPSCCTALSGMVASNPRCLCTVLGAGASSLGVTVNGTRALELPGACGVETPPASQCNSGGVPSPATLPMPSTTTPASTQTPAVPDVITPAGAGSKATPTMASTSQYSSGGQSIGGATLIAVIVVVTAALALLRV